MVTNLLALSSPSPSSTLHHTYYDNKKTEITKKIERERIDIIQRGKFAHIRIVIIKIDLLCMINHLACVNVRTKH